MSAVAEVKLTFTSVKYLRAVAHFCVMLGLQEIVMAFSCCIMLMENTGDKIW